MMGALGRSNLRTTKLDALMQLDNFHPIRAPRAAATFATMERYQ